MLLLLLACATPEPAEIAPVDSGEGDTASVTYYADAKPILDRACIRCHEGALATSFTDPAYVQALAPVIAQYTAEGKMPPPAPNPTCRDYEGSEKLFLSDADKATLQAWSDAGAPLGDPATYPGEPAAETIAPFDISMMAGTYTPNFAGDGNDYRCFLLEAGNEERAYITGFEAIVGNKSIVHHIVLYTLDDSVTVDASPGGFECGGFGEEGWSFFVGWAPGAEPVKLPEGTALSIDANQRFVLNMHYFGSADDLGNADTSGYGFTTTTEAPEHSAFVYPLGVEGFTVPANEAAHEEDMRFRWPSGYGTLKLMAASPHMHLLGSAFSLTAGDDCVVDAPQWDFHNQITSIFTEPVSVEPGDSIQLTCTWDNSATSKYQYNDPPLDVEFGEETTQEMCYAFTYGWLE